jgi:diguanylate cyclase (GGDEF)-like protein
LSAPARARDLLGGRPEHEQAVRSLVFRTALVAAAGEGVVALHSYLDGVLRPFFLLLAGLCGSLLAAWLARRGKIPAAARVLFGATLSTCALLVATGSRGTHDPGMLAFSALMVVASMVPDRRAFFLGAGTTLLAAAAIFAAELGGLTAGRLRHATNSDLGDAFDVGVVLVATALVARTVSQMLFAALRDAQRLADEDHLTGLPNLRRMLADLEQRLRGAREHGAPLWVVLLDLDRFRFVNNLGGPSAGDAALRMVAQRLRAALPGADLVGRQGGNEFLALISSPARKAGLEALLPRLLAALCEPLEIEGRRYELTASAGVALFPEDGVDAPTLLRRAGLALQQAKRLGGNTWVSFDPTLGLRAEEDLRLSQELQLATRRGDLVLHYQPIFAARTHALLGFEALLRWRRGPGGAVRSPDTFIRHAEETGYIVEIGEWVLKEACRQLAVWRAQTGLDLGMAVNVSARQAADQNLAGAVAQALSQSGLPPATLTLELTESAMMAQELDPRALMGRLKALGVRLALDDFGTGYSSLAYLRRLPLDLLKIDRGFLADIPGEAHARVVLDAIIRLAQELKITVVAEGVENEAQRAYLEAQGCNRLQGYLLSRPLDEEGVQALLGRQAVPARSAAG